MFPGKKRKAKSKKEILKKYLFESRKRAKTKKFGGRNKYRNERNKWQRKKRV